MFRKKRRQHHHNHHESSLENAGANHLKHHHKKPRKKIGLFYKISFAFSLLVTLILLYFIILVSAKPKSFPYITNKIEEYLENNFANEASIENSTITFTPYGSFKIAAQNIKLKKLLPNGESQEFILPQVESEFSLFDLLIFRLSPSKIKLGSPEIVIDNFQENNKAKNAADQGFMPLINLFETIKKNKLHIKYLEVENAKFIIKSENKNAIEVFLKSSQSRIKSRFTANEEVLYISSNNIVNVNNGKEIAINASCNFRNSKSTNCNLSLANLDIATVAFLNPNLKILQKIKTTLSANAAIFLADGKMTNLSFKAEAKNGEADLPEFFSQKLFFENITVRGDYNSELDTLNLAEIKSDLTQSNSAQITNYNALKPQLKMSLLLHDLQNEQNNKTDFYISLENIPNSDLKKYWLTSLPAQDIRQWVIDHIYGGIINDSYAKFSLNKKDGEYNLENLDAKVNFSEINLKYDDYFPVVTSASGSAAFSQKDMKISLINGEILNSKIENALITINDFSDPISMLNISGKINGNAADGLKHANYKSAFAFEIEKYLNGSAHSEIDIRLPLTNKLALKDLYIAVKSNISGANNDFIIGNISISVLKKFHSNNFATSVDLTNAALIAKAFDIEKNIGATGNLNLDIIVENDNSISIKNLHLYKKEKIQNKIIEGKISANMAFATAPFMVKLLNIKNDNFGNNNYVLNYNSQIQQNFALQKISLTGKVFNLASFLENKMPAFASSDIPTKTNLNINIDKILLAHKKSLRKFSLAFARNNQIFTSGFLSASYGNKQLINFSFSKKTENNFPVISGIISDVGYLAEGMNISDTISSGNAKIKITQNEIEKNIVYNADINIDSDITFYENNTTKRLESNSLFSKVKDSIFSNNKTIFDSVKADLTLNKNILQINSLIANNYKIGITAKGYVNLSDNIYDLKGMIVPGFVINNLFGIGKIPLIGGVISGLLTGGEGGGVFGIKYEYKKLEPNKEPTFTTDTVSSFVPVSIRNLFDLI